MAAGAPTSCKPNGKHHQRNQRDPADSSAEAPSDRQSSAQFGRSVAGTSTTVVPATRSHSACRLGDTTSHPENSQPTPHVTAPRSSANGIPRS